MKHITERMLKEIRKGEIVKTKKYVYWSEFAGDRFLIKRADRELEGYLEYRDSIITIGEYV